MITLLNVVVILPFRSAGLFRHEFSIAGSEWNIRSAASNFPVEVGGGRRWIRFSRLGLDRLGLEHMFKSVQRFFLSWLTKRW